MENNSNDGGGIVILMLCVLGFFIMMAFALGKCSVISADDYLNKPNDYVVDTTIVHSANGGKTLKFHVKSKKSMAY